MKKPIEFWTWEALKSWVLFGRRKRRRAATQCTKCSLQFEQLDARRVLAADLGVDELKDGSLIQSPETSLESPFAAEGEGTIESDESVQQSITTDDAISYDVNGDGKTSPIDALLVINAINKLAKQGTIADEVFAACDVDADGEISDADVTLIVDYLNSETAQAAAD